MMSFLTKNSFRNGIWKMIVMVNRATKDTFSCLKILFHVLKISKKKEYMEMVENFYLETRMSVLGSSIYHYLNGEK